MHRAYCSPYTHRGALAGLWAQVLEIERVGIHDNFYELGGDSILATQLVSRIREITCRVVLPQLF